MSIGVREVSVLASVLNVTDPFSLASVIVSNSDYEFVKPQNFSFHRKCDASVAFGL